MNWTFPWQDEDNRVSSLITVSWWHYLCGVCWQNLTKVFWFSSPLTFENNALCINSELYLDCGGVRAGGGNIACPLEKMTKALWKENLQKMQALLLFKPFFPFGGVVMILHGNSWKVWWVGIRWFWFCVLVRTRRENTPANKDLLAYVSICYTVNLKLLDSRTPAANNKGPKTGGGGCGCYTLCYCM